MRNGHIATVEVLDGPSDEAVIEQAQTLFKKHATDFDGFEIWQCAKFVYRYPELPPRYASVAPLEALYHLYLLGEDGIIQGTFDFSADSDETAYEIGEIAFDACLDCAEDFEVLHGSRLINPTLPMLMTTVDQVMANHQAEVVALEERMRDSRWAVAKSERLRARLKELKTPKVAADQPEMSAKTRVVT